MVDHGQTMVRPWTNHGLPWLPSMNNHVQNMVDHGQTVVLLPGLKAIAKRTEPLLSFLIHPDQTGFVKNRYIGVIGV